MPQKAFQPACNSLHFRSSSHPLLILTKVDKSWEGLSHALTSGGAPL
ncbi:hypothetical protein [Methanosarcina sp. WWM596]|nr:hypothetical protein [Methanosarcina sp. WWM596]